MLSSKFWGGLIGFGYIVNFSSKIILLNVFIIPNGKTDFTSIIGTSKVPLLSNLFLNFIFSVSLTSKLNE